MKFLAVLGVLLIQCAATKSWNNDSYSEEMFSVFGWIGYLKRLAIIVLMFSCVVLYYVPESRPHARRMCYALIDFTANGLKSVLSGRESNYMYEKMKSKYHRAKYEQLVAQKRQSREIQEDGVNFERAQTRSKKAKALIGGDELLGDREKKKVSGKQSKDHRQSRHRLRNGIIKNSSCMEITKPIYFYSDKLDDLQKYVKSNLNGAKHANVENYALVISGSPQQMALLDQKYEKDDVVIVQDPYLRVEYKECGTSTDKLSSKGDASSSEQEGPTRDHNDHATDSNLMSQGMETYVKDVDLYSIPEGSVPRYSDYTALYQTSQYQCGGESCSGNGCSVSSGDMNNNLEAVNTISPADIKNVLKASRSMVTTKPQKKIVEEGTESLYDVNYNKRNEKRPLKFSNDRKVDLRKDQERNQEPAQKHDETIRQHESTSRCVRWGQPRTEDPLAGFCCNNTSYFTDRGGEADDENSQHGVRATAKHDLDERPQKENIMSAEPSDHSIFDYDFEDFCAKPILKNRLKPALLRAVNWIFGGCPEASRRAAMKPNEVGKEEIQAFADEWLL